MDIQVYKKQLGRDVKAGMSTRAIARKYKCSQAHAYRTLRTLGIKTIAKSGPPRRANSNERCAACNAALSHYRKTYCNNACQQDHSFANFLARWLNDEKFNPLYVNYRSAPRLVRRALIATRGERCEKCGWHEVNPKTGRIPVQIHHEDGNDRNNRPQNVGLLCPNCHSLTPAWGAKNKRKHPMPRIGVRGQGRTANL